MSTERSKDLRKPNYLDKVEVLTLEEACVMAALGVPVTYDHNEHGGGWWFDTHSFDIGWKAHSTEEIAILYEACKDRKGFFLFIVKEQEDGTS